MSQSQTPRQKWAQARIDEVYANNGHPYFTADDRPRRRLSAAMLRLHQVTAPPDRPSPGEQVVSVASLMGRDAFTGTAQQAADFLARANGLAGAPKAPGAGLEPRSPAPPAMNSMGNGIANVFGISGVDPLGLGRAPADRASGGVPARPGDPVRSANEPAASATPDQADAAPPRLASQSQAQPPEITNPSGGAVRRDVKGNGEFGAPRGHGPHQGIDILTTPGDAVTSPIDGKIARHGFVYGDEDTRNGKQRQYYLVEIEGSGKYTGMTIKIFYIERNSRLAIGTVVKAGQSRLGIGDDLRIRYGASIRPHVHIEVEWHGKKIDPALVLPNLRSGRP